MTQSWSTPVHEYCERVDPGFWGEPLNEFSNAAFLVAAAFAFQRWRRSGANDPAVLTLILVLVAVGFGSFAYHALATRGAALLDVVPIALFIHGYLLLALHRFLRLAVVAALGILVAFAAFSVALPRLAPQAFLNGSVGYLPALAAMVAIGGLSLGPARRSHGPAVLQPADESRREQARTGNIGRMLLGCAALFLVSLALRTVDLALCHQIPHGTHFLWHLLNAVVLYALLQAAISAPIPEFASLRGEVSVRTSES